MDKDTVTETAFESANYLLAQAEAERDQLRAEVARLTAEREAVCEWVRMEYGDWHDIRTACGVIWGEKFNPSIGQSKYCPDCGKRIKFVEPQPPAEQP